MQMKKLASATVAALLMVGALQTAAYAGSGDCESGDACLWRDTNYETANTGSAWVAFEYGINNLNGWYYRGKGTHSSYRAANSASSIYSNGNNWHMQACFYDGKYYTGSMRCLTPKTGRANLSWSWFNDCIESGRFIQD